MESESEAKCAHVAVRWATEEFPGGNTKGWWECRDCCTRFTPESLLTSALSAKEAAEAQIAELVAVLKEVDGLIASDPDMCGNPRWHFRTSRGATVESVCHAVKDALTVPIRAILERAQLKDAVVKAAGEWRDDEEDVPEIGTALLAAVDALRAAEGVSNG